MPNTTIVYYVHGNTSSRHYSVSKPKCTFVNFSVYNIDSRSFNCLPDGTPWFNVRGTDIMKLPDDKRTTFTCVPVTPRCCEAKQATHTWLRQQNMLDHARSYYRHAIVVWDNDTPKISNGRFQVVNQKKDIDRSSETPLEEMRYLVLDAPGKSVVEVWGTMWLASDQKKPLKERRMRKNLVKIPHLEYTVSTARPARDLMNIGCSDFIQLKSYDQHRKEEVNPDDIIVRALLQKRLRGDFDGDEDDYSSLVTHPLLGGDVTMAYKKRRV